MPNEIPAIDFSQWLQGSQEEKQQVARDLVDACRRVGFVYVVNHGVGGELLGEAFQWSKRLFDLPQEKKMLAPHPPGPTVHRGYSWPGLEKVSQYIPRDGDNTDAVEEELRKVQDYKESYEVGSEDFADQPNVWLPEDVLPGFRPFMTTFYWHCFDTAKELLRAVGMGLGLEDASHLLQFHSGINNQLRLLHYPPVASDKLSSNALARMPAHSDWGSITLLFQDECGGLQVESPDSPGVFLDATPTKGALIMNVGDLLMRWSNDHLKSTLHRVTLPPLEPKQGGGAPAMTPPRYSIPYFVAPDPPSVIECLPCCSSEGNPPKYAPVTQSDYRRMRSQLQYTSAR